MPIKSSLDETINNGLFALFKGKPGTAKSTAALSFPKAFVFDFDKKMPAIAKKHYPGKDIQWETFDTIFTLADFMNKMLADGCPYETLIFDSVTSLSTTFLNSIAGVKGESVMKQLSVMIKTKQGDMSIETLGIDYYNGETSFFERFILEVGAKLFAKAGNPKHVIILAHILETESAPDLRTKIVTTTRTILTAGRRAATLIEKAFDNNFYFTIGIPQTISAFSASGSTDKVQRLCYTEPFGQDMARSAFNFPGKIDFTDKNFYDILNGVAKWDQTKS